MAGTKRGGFRKRGGLALYLGPEHVTLKCLPSLRLKPSGDGKNRNKQKEGKGEDEKHFDFDCGFLLLCFFIVCSMIIVYC